MAHPNDTKLTPEQNRHMQILRQAEKGHEAALDRKTVTDALRKLHEDGLRDVREKIAVLRKEAGLER